ncbi:MAG TPA: 1,4-dihydroxy-2-naphthoate octaprenyltransferase [Ktedonobacteraceae bacterium]|nr:1,4-dihydroxy-2-naphthoate octaprenyltransferase [Ktedonobacteraceae bacterium]
MLDKNSSSSSDNNDATVTVSQKKARIVTSSQVVAAPSVQAEEVPTIPMSSLQTLNALQPEVSVAATQAVRRPAPLVVQPSEYRRGMGESLQVWWDGIRPAYLPLSIMPVLLGTTLAWTQSISTKTLLGHLRITHFVATLLAVVLLQIGAQLINDYYDYVRGIDTSNTFGPGGLIQQGFVQPTRVLLLGIIALCAGILIGAVVAVAGGFYVLLFGVIGVLGAYLYSATTHSLSSIALGEVVSFLIFGPLITFGTYLVQMNQTNAPSRPQLISVLLYSIALGLFATAIMHVNNMRDAESDEQAKKHTLATLLGIRLSRALFFLLVLGAYIIVIALGIPRNTPHLTLITLWTLPLLLVTLTGMLRADLPASLHLVMRQALKLETYFTLWLIVALIISAFYTALPGISSHIPL